MERFWQLFLRAFINIVLIVVLIVLVTTVGYYNKLEGAFRTERGIETYLLSTFNKSKMYPIDPKYIPDDQTRFCLENNYINVEANVSAVDPMLDTVRVRLKFIPCGDFGDYSKTLGSSVPLAMGVNLTFGSNVIVFKEKGVMSPGKEDSLPIYFASGDINAYPWDVYTTNVEYITALYKDKNNDTHPCPLSLSLIGSYQSWSFSLPIVEDLSMSSLGTPYRDGTLIGMQMIVTRSWTVKLFSIIITIIIWVLPLLSMLVGVTTLSTDRKPEPPTMSMAIAMLFALPAVRNSQPNVPPFGTTLDVFSFYLAYLLQAICATLLLAKYIVKIEVLSVPKPPEPKKEVKPIAISTPVVDPPLRDASRDGKGSLDLTSTLR